MAEPLKVTKSDVAVFEDRQVPPIEPPTAGQKNVERFHKLWDKDKLLREIQDRIQAEFNVGNWDPVVHMAILAVKTEKGYLVYDKNGEPVYDEETQEQVFHPPDLKLSASIAAKVAPYLHAQHTRVGRTEIGETGSDAAELATIMEEALGLST